ncbi:MAG TPA: outer membrane lipoprotein carrier protein LolA [Kofleriaceae bacterium]|nr:outer membrane lipoprotein carrier protein LolA [Kofleriaceae bacterium]
MLKASVAGIVVALAVIALAGVADAQTRTAAQVIADVQKTYAGVNDMTAAFEQEVTNVTFGKTSIVKGKLWLKRPGKMRWDYIRPRIHGKPAKTVKSFVFDGAWLWMIDLENQQLVKQSVRDQLLPVAVAFLSGKTAWAADFRAKLDVSGAYGAAGDVVVLLLPKHATAAYENLYLVVDPTTSQVRESIIIDPGGNVNHFTFTDLNLAATNRETIFEVDPSRAMFANFRVVNVTPPPPAKPAPKPPAPKKKPARP